MAKTPVKKATASDARIVMKLYDLRREAEMRKARNWYAQWDLKTYDDLKQLSMNFGSQENAWFRQVLTYWENAASLVLRGAVHRDLFMDWNGEMIFTFVKVRPYLKQMREASGAVDFLGNIEKLLNSTPELRKKTQHLEEQFKKWSAMRAQAAAGKS
jgi:hypothetical protein